MDIKTNLWVLFLDVFDLVYQSKLKEDQPFSLSANDFHADYKKDFKRADVVIFTNNQKEYVIKNRFK